MNGLVLILIINLIITILCAVIWNKKCKGILIVIYFLFLPILGPGIYFLSGLLYQLKKETGYDRETLVKRLDIEAPRQAPMMKKELNIVSVEEAMAVGKVSEKRELMLEQLKKEDSNKYRHILVAGRDEDSETAHYVAAAKMEAYRKKFAEIIELKNQIKDSGAAVREYNQLLLKIEDYIESGLVEEKEATIYMEEYCKIMDENFGLEGDTFTTREYTNYIRYLIVLKENEKVEAFWNKQHDKDKNEESYLAMLRYYYDNLQKDKFYQCIDELKKSDIILSPGGLELFRYWESRR